MSMMKAPTQFERRILQAIGLHPDSAARDLVEFIYPSAEWWGREGRGKIGAITRALRRLHKKGFVYPRYGHRKDTTWNLSSVIVRGGAT